MASRLETALYSPYGAYELKAKYQRNFGIGTLATLGTVLLILAVAWIMSMESDVVAINAAPVVVKTVAELGPPPTIAKKPPQVQVAKPQISAPKVGIPKPVADDEVVDDDVVLATREELAEIVAPDISIGEGGGDIVVDIADDEYLPEPDEFVPVEEIAQMVYQATPEYPRLAKTAGLEGLVWVKALVDKDGSVRDAMIYKSSGTTSLDEAALAVAKQNRFKPAIQNNRPVAMWVTYKVSFELDNQ